MASALDALLNAGSNIDPQDLERRAAMSQMLAQQSLTPDQGQMVSGHYIAPAFAGLGKIAQALMSRQMNRDVSADRQTLARQRAAALAGMIDGQPSSPATTTPEQGAAYGLSGPVPQAQFPNQTTPSSFGSQNLLKGLAIQEMGGPQAAAAYWKQYEPTEQTKMALAAGMSPADVNRMGIQKQAMFEMQPGTTTLNLLTGQQQFQPKVGEGITIQNGQAYAIPNYAQSNAQIQGAQALAQKGAEAYYTPETIDTNQGRILTTRSNVVKGVNQSGGIQLQGAGEAQAEQERGKFFGTTYNELQKSAMDAGGKISRIDRMESLLQDVNTGKLTPNGTELASYVQSLGFHVDKNLGNKQAAQALSNEIALQLRNPSGGAGMPGAMSDSDRAFLSSMTPSLAKTPEGNIIIMQTMRKLAQRDQEVAQLARNYKGGALDNGFFQQLQDYSNSHPLFSAPAQQTQSAVIDFGSLK